MIKNEVIRSKKARLAGHSITITIPADLVKELNVTGNCRFIAKVEDGKLIFEKKKLVV